MDISNEIAKALSDYTTEVQEEIEEIAEKVAEEAVSTLKVTSPTGRRSRYAKGWRKKKDGKGYVIFNATDAGLTHLVEKGHAKRNGGRTKSFNHIQNAEETAIKDFENKIERAIKR